MDANFSYRKLLLHLNGTANSTTFTDTSLSARTTYALGYAKLQTSSPMFGSADALISENSQAAGAIEVRDMSGLTLSGDFTVEMHVVRSATQDSLNQTLFGILVDGTSEYWWLRLRNTTDEPTISLSSPANGITAQNVALGAWTGGTRKHVAWERVGSTNTVYVDGVAQITVTYGSTITPEKMFFGGFVVSDGTIDPTFPDSLDGRLDEIRITVGLAEYSAAFTPPSAEFEEATVEATIDVPDILSTTAGVACVGLVPNAARTAVESPLGSCAVLGVHDFTGSISYAQPIRYVMDLVTPGGLVRVPISSWQATLQTTGQSYLACVIPSCSVWIDALTTASDFVISRIASFSDTQSIEYEMARAPLQNLQLDQGPSNYTASINGYLSAYPADDNPPSAYDRTLAGIRSISSYSSGATRVRCAIDWLLRPGHRAWLDENTSFVVGYLNLYVPQGNDEYMDVGYSV